MGEDSAAIQVHEVILEMNTVCWHMVGDPVTLGRYSGSAGNQENQPTG